MWRRVVFKTSGLNVLRALARKVNERTTCVISMERMFVLPRPLAHALLQDLGPVDPEDDEKITAGDVATWRKYLPR
jgi:hypothetical protein